MNENFYVVNTTITNTPTNLDNVTGIIVMLFIALALFTGMLALLCALGDQ